MRATGAGDTAAATCPDEVLLDRARAGSRSAFAELCERHLPQVRRYAAGLFGGSPAAKEVADGLVAEAVAATWYRLAAGAGPRDRFAAHLCLVIRSRERAERRLRGLPGTAASGPAEFVA